MSIADLLSPEDLAKMRSSVKESTVSEEGSSKELDEAKEIILAFLHADIQDPKAQEAIAMAREFLLKQPRKEEG